MVFPWWTLELAKIGLKVNVGKSEIVLVGEVGNLDALARILC